jgi:carboxyl-terminal processing protease
MSVKRKMNPPECPNVRASATRGAQSRSITICFIVALAVVFCVGVASWTARIVAADTENRLSPKDRVEVFETVWKDVRDTYYDPEFHGVNWQQVHDRYRPQLDQVKTDDEFYVFLNRMTGELQDAHTRVSSPQQWENRIKQQGVGVGLAADEFNGKVVITSVTPDSNAAHAGLMPGMEVVSVDGRPVEDAVKSSAAKVSFISSERITHLRTIGGIFSGPPATNVSLVLRRADETEFTVTLARQVLSLPPDVRSHTLASGDDYIRFDGFQPVVEKQFKEALAGFHGAHGLIVDLRSNGGGNSHALAIVARELLGPKVAFLKTMTRKDVTEAEAAPENKNHMRDFKTAGDGDRQFAGPVVILTATRTASASELFAASLQELGRARVVGTQTCGCAIGISNNQKLKGGAVLEVSQVLWFTPKGRKIEGDGVIPDVVAFPTVSDLQQNRDVVLDAAEKLLQVSPQSVRGGSN